MTYTTLEYFFYGKLGRDEFKKLPFGSERAAAAFVVPANLLTLGMIIAVWFMRHYLYHINSLLVWEIILGYGVILAVLWIILYRHLKQEKNICA
ncbi:hypothetical protein [Methanocorpusculum vombati]|uniref:Uncharacterized protein n=1 Tax=Methanocorpusculum vombati TaxID=3002864 RepID=A0ABT4IKR2_9EURY|nr:hypothetical protein [Methanocorpusculum vombati]MCZ9319934.1 hypothetical protein [Methanocorpusculum sp.]MCZ0862340.1 hypothetical protein [Methanocorpusculum vombati]MDE2519959.1 hypothetical protein [Methanocorpusculum sp.]MDE2546526.1 hypothetical protein [Methanocorpusculum sp.]MDE2547222.1 hypothetical protein [Methanocorpusculum sp.]